MWTFEHFITIAPTYFLMICLGLILKRFLGKKDISMRMIPFKIFAVILFVSEIVKQVLSLTRGYNLYHLPFHVCSLFIFLIPLMAFYNGKYKDLIKSFTCMTMVALFICMLVAPGLIYTKESIKGFFVSYFDFHTVFFHLLVIFELFLTLILDLHPNYQNHFKSVLVFGIIYVLIAAPLAQILETNFSNFYTCNIRFIYDLVDSAKHYIGAGLTQFIYVMLLGIVHILFFGFSYYIYTLLNKLFNNKIVISNVE